MYVYVFVHKLDLILKMQCAFGNCFNRQKRGRLGDGETTLKVKEINDTDISYSSWGLNFDEDKENQESETGSGPTKARPGKPGD